MNSHAEQGRRAEQHGAPAAGTRQMAPSPCPGGSPKSTREANISQPAPPPGQGTGNQSQRRDATHAAPHTPWPPAHVHRTDTTPEATWGARQGPWLVEGQRKGWAGNATSPRTTAPSQPGPRMPGGGAERPPGKDRGWAPGRTHTRAPPAPGTGALPRGLLTMVTERPPLSATTSWRVLRPPGPGRRL